MQVNMYEKWWEKERSHAGYTINTIEFDGGHEMVLGFIESDCKRKLVNIDGNINSKNEIC